MKVSTHSTDVFALTQLGEGLHRTAGLMRSSSGNASIGWVSASSPRTVTAAPNGSRSASCCVLASFGLDVGINMDPLAVSTSSADDARLGSIGGVGSHTTCPGCSAV